MPIIKKEDINEEYFGKYILTTIMPDGKIICIERDQEEHFHVQAFSRLIKEIERIIQIKISLSGERECYDFLKLFSGKGMIIIATYYIYQQPYRMEQDIQIIKFPKNIKKAQLNSMKQLLIAFEKIGYIEFNEYGMNDEDANIGLDRLKKYVTDKIKNTGER